MALWGSKDGKTASGTITVAANTTTGLGEVTGVGTDFITEANVGDYIIAQNGDYYIITEIANTTQVTVKAGGGGSDVVNAVSGNTYSLTEQPLFVSEAEAQYGFHGDPELVYGVDTNEMAAERAAGSAVPTHAGWVRRIVGTGGRSGRVQYETLVAMGKSAALMGDAEDTVFEDFYLSIVTQPQDATANSGANEVATFTVVATSTPSTTLTYSWEYTTDAGNVDSFAAANTGDFTANGATLDAQSNGISDGTLIRVVVSATGADSVTSSAATLTVTA
jgi:hypothetical protein